MEYARCGNEKSRHLSLFQNHILLLEIKVGKKGFFTFIFRYSKSLRRKYILYKMDSCFVGGNSKAEQQKNFYAFLDPP